MRNALYTTMDGSLISELIRPDTDGSRHLSLAEASIAPGESTHRHLHRQSEEIYYILAGEGTVEIGGQIRRAEPGEVFLIPPGTEHRATNLGSSPLRLLCACSPPYEHEDTVLTEGQLA